MSERQKSEAERLHEQGISLFKGLQICQGTTEGQAINQNMKKVLDSLHSLIISEITGGKGDEAQR